MSTSGARAVDLDHLDEPLLVLPLEAARAAEAGIVDEHADLEIRDGRGEPPGALGRSEIDDYDARRDAALLRELRGERLEPLDTARAEHEREALARERPRERGADSRRRAGDERPFAIALAQRTPRRPEAIARAQQRDAERREWHERNGAQHQAPSAPPIRSIDQSAIAIATCADVEPLPTATSTVASARSRRYPPRRVAQCSGSVALAAHPVSTTPNQTSSSRAIGFTKKSNGM